MNREFNLNHSFFCWHLILCIPNVDILGICIKKFDVLKLFFDKMAAFLTQHFFSDFLHFDMSLLLLTVTLREYLISIAYCLFFHLILPFVLLLRTAIGL